MAIDFSIPANCAPPAKLARRHRQNDSGRQAVATSNMVRASRQCTPADKRTSA